jgi:hypothetical protein
MAEAGEALPFVVATMAPAPAAGVVFLLNLFAMPFPLGAGVMVASLAQSAIKQFSATP